MSSNLDLLLINVGGTKKKVYQDLSKDFSAIEPPFWAALTAGFIRNKGYNVKIIDANAENLTHKETARIVKEDNPKLTNIVVYGQHPSASTQLMTGVGELSNEIKKIEPNRKIILTGLHPSALPRRTLKEENCDFVCQGEGFYTLQGLLENSKPNNIPGLWWKENGNIRNTPREKNMQNLSKELDSVAWDLLPMDKYKAHNWQCLDNLDSRFGYASISTSLGCPFTCDFCSIHETFGEKRIRTWDSEWVVNQLKTLQEKYNIKNIKIIDEMFILNSNHFMEIAEKIIKEDLKLNIWAYGRVDTIKEKYLGKLKKAGFNWLCVGYEAGNEKVREDVHKGKFTKDSMIENRKIIKNSGINVIANYMFGLPEDNLDSMRETLDLAKELNCEFGNFYCTTAMPGSQLYKNAIQENVKLSKKWIDYAQHSYNFLPLPTKHLSPKEVLEFRDYAFDNYFKNPEYLKMIESEFGPKAEKHLKNMTKTKLKRKLLEE
ncbi:B12-binding domain-containing radical SAM protein [Candidatus Pacearchaeota archaeon]|jgi:radical SAM superfamily enzyme YgiQ (UPF0313 family)|nr:B12-binding domain-containing radical SAM protein [Candidatus Pacearchaeota archaeon]